MHRLTKYFPALTPHQLALYEQMETHVRDWNDKINVISRRDVDNILEHHILHSLALAKVLHLQPGQRVMDLGTGGGFPGVPLAVMFPQTNFVLADSIRKKTLVCSEIAKALELTNVSVEWARAESLRGPFDVVVSRAVMPMADLLRTVRGKTHRVACLKGGDLAEELAGLKAHIEVTPIANHFAEDFFQTKSIVYAEIS